MKLSIVLLVHNALSFIDTSLRSIADHHGIDDYEIVVVDGNSEDGSITKCQSFLPEIGPRFKYCMLNNNKQADMYNAGLDLAKGEYIYFMMAGDKLCEGFFTDAISALDKTHRDMFTRNFISDGKNATALYDQLHIGPMLGTTVIRKDAIDIRFEGDACVDILFSTRLLARGAFLYKDDGYNSIEHNDDSYWWANQQSNDFLRAIDYNWIEYIHTMIDNSDDMINVSIHVEDKCNKDCISCGHFSPLVPKDTPSMTPEEFMTDIKYLLPYRQHIRSLILTGGEPTLNPYLPQIIRIACDNFDHVRVVSNGLNPGFFAEHRNLIVETGVEVYITKYSKELKDQVKKNLTGITVNGYSIETLEDDDGVREMFYSKMLSPKRMNNLRLLGVCGRGECCQLVGSRLYLCQYTANFKFFDKFFKNHPLPGVGDSFIDLANGDIPYKRIRKFIYEHNCALCWHCKECLLYDGHYEEVERVPLTHSKKEMSEWVG